MVREATPPRPADDAARLFRCLGSWIPTGVLGRIHEADRTLHERWLGRTPLHPLFWLRRAIWSTVGTVAPRMGGMVVDLGCGDCRYGPLLTQADRVFGLDLDSGSAAHALSDASALPVRTAGADALICTEVLEHVEDPAAVVEEAARVLRPGAVALFTVPFAFPVHDLHDHRRLSALGLDRLLSQHGFAVESVRPLTTTAQSLATLCNLQIFDQGLYWTRAGYAIGAVLRPGALAATAAVNLSAALDVIGGTHLPIGYAAVAVR